MPAAPAATDPPTDRAARLRAAAPLAFVLLVFLVSRVAAWRAGVRFDGGSLPWFGQWVEPELLRTRLCESVYYLHAQPPLFNLFLGVVLKLFGGAATAAFGAVYFGAGALLAACLFGLMTRLAVPCWPAALLAAGFAASPPAVLYEHWLFYTHPEAVLLCASALAFHRFVESPRRGRGVLLFALLAALALARSTFHLLWLFGVLGLALVGAGPAARRLTLRVAALPLLLVVAVYAKNALHFGTFTTSSWFGMNLAQIALRPLPPERRSALVRSGRASELASLDPFLPLRAYPEAFRRPVGPDAPVLRREAKAGGWPNLHHSAYIRVSRAYARDAVASVRAYPASYLRTVGRALQLYLVPASDYPFIAGNRAHLRALEGPYNRYVFGTYGARDPVMRGEWLAPHEIPERCAWAWAALLVLGPLSALALAARAWRRAGALGARHATALLLAFDIVYVTAVSNLFEFGENNRLRFPVDPLVLAVGAAAASAALRELGRRVARRPQPSPSA